MEQRKTYTAEFKLEAVRLARAPGNTIRGIARELGLHETVLHRWIQRHEAKGELAFPGHGRPALTPEQQEIERLKKELEVARQERDILKKAVAFFAKESG